MRFITDKTTLIICLLIVLMTSAGSSSTLFSKEPVKSGLDILTMNSFKQLKGKRVALVTNRTAVNRKEEHLLDLCLKNSITVVKIFTPEHGFSAEKDTKIDNKQKGEIPLISLYGKRRELDPKDLSDIDVIIFDIQSVGARYYTYIATMVYTMRAAAAANKEMIVLDRPNPSGGVIVSGFMPEEGLTGKFTSIYPIPIRHGMTPGELALMFNSEHGIDCPLTVIKMKGWNRSMLFSDTNLPWINPSPNIRREEAAILYNGLGWLETTNISMARGTDYAFEMLGAPYIDSKLFVKKLGTVAGVVIKPVLFTPRAKYHKHFEKKCHGIQIFMTDKHNFDGFTLGLTIYKTLNEMYPKEYSSFSGLITSSGRRDLKSIMKKKNVSAVVSGTTKELTAFKKIRSKYLLYK
ncbi:MAG: DUF1343 domain-containing protein [Spirochaetes bacterium]|jgi:uncharacterized protein YbbC (DUF1343 family)|nr:DUF1343 domain-containing protein [Spirochaetota bacterium]